jgi:hypothetical protein
MWAWSLVSPLRRVLSMSSLVSPVMKMAAHMCCLKAPPQHNLSYPPGVAWMWRAAHPDQHKQGIPRGAYHNLQCTRLYLM